MNAVTETVDLQAPPPAPLVFTDSAAAKVKDLLAEEGNPELKLRVFVQGGGCSGFSTASPSMKSSTKMTPCSTRLACSCWSTR